jgi:phospholipid/cholesterol/gamma-HCH transport system substrate-binding protein
VQRVSIARGITLAVLAGVLVLLAVVLLRGDGAQRYTLRFQTAGQLVKDDDVQIGGRRIGSVRGIELTSDNHADVEIEVSGPYAPLHEGTSAVIRATSLSGIANRYVALTPGAGPALREGTLLSTNDTTPIVDLDQLFNTFDARTRRALQRVVQGQARWLDGKGPEANQVAKYFNPTLSTTRDLVNEVNRDSRTLERFLVQAGSTMGALAEKRETLTALVSNANNAAEGIANENENFETTLARLPTTLRRANSTFVNLRSTLDDLDVLVAESKPATRRLAPFFRELRPVIGAARPTIRDLRLAITRKGKDNDLLELTRKAPKLQRVGSPSLRATTAALRKATPVLDFIRPYAPDLQGWLRDFGQEAANYDANGHYARIQPIFNLFQFTDNPAGGTLTPQDPDDRLDGLETGMFKRCPGSASQVPPDRSAPFTDNGLDCDPRQVPPGP